MLQLSRDSSNMDCNLSIICSTWPKIEGLWVLYAKSKLFFKLKNVRRFLDSLNDGYQISLRLQRPICLKAIKCSATIWNLSSTQCLISAKMSHLNIASEASYVYISSGQKLIKNAEMSLSIEFCKMRLFKEFFNTVSFIFQRTCCKCNKVGYLLCNLYV